MYEKERIDLLEALLQTAYIPYLNNHLIPVLLLHYHIGNNN